MFELRLQCPEPSVDMVSDALEALDAKSVSVEDADHGTAAEKAIFGEPGMPPPRSAWQQSLVVALFDTQAQAQEALELLKPQDFFANCTVLALCVVEQQDWVRLTQAQFQPVEIDPHFWIVPSWHTVPPQASTVIHLDPGMAFGTGTHPTTRMCLRWLAKNMPALRAKEDLRALDYGCGSGILAIGAAKLGAHQVDAVDIDEAAVQATLLNAQANQVSLAVGLPDLAQGAYDIVLANILASPLKVLAPLLHSHVAPGGHLVLAGILARQAQELTDAYAPYCALQVVDEEDGWILMRA